MYAVLAYVGGAGLYLLSPPQEKGEGKSMGEQENAGLTLEELAQRLEALERENERMRSENAELRNKVATLEDSGTRRGELAENRGSDTRRSEEAAAMAFDGQVSRRLLLSKAGAAAAGLVMAGALTQRDIREAKAAPGYFTSDSSSPAISAENRNDHGVGVESTAGQIGLYVTVANNLKNDDSAAVYARGSGPGYGVRGRSDNGPGVQGSSIATGVWGKGRTGVLGSSQDIYGQQTGTGDGVVGEGMGSRGAGVLGRNSKGYGGKFEGGTAQLLLVPQGTAGKPKGLHSKGELYLDSNATLFVCTASGFPGTWRQATTTAA
jgi:hypothetical protein